MAVVRPVLVHGQPLPSITQPAIFVKRATNALIPWADGRLECPRPATQRLRIDTDVPPESRWVEVLLRIAENDARSGYVRPTVRLQ
jgi:hypothetical protein